MPHQLILPDKALISRDSPLLWISSCLLGQKVRYDGKDKFHRGVVSLSKIFNHYSLCPELEMGLGVPREPISLSGEDLIQNKSGHSLKQLAQKTTREIIMQLDAPHALIIKSKSPSCGFNSAINLKNNALQSGIFTKAVSDHYHEVKIADENDLNSLSQILSFAQTLGANEAQLQDLQSVWNSLA